MFRPSCAAINRQIFRNQIKNPAVGWVFYCNHGCCRGYLRRFAHSKIYIGGPANEVIPGGVDADRYAHGDGGAAILKIKELYPRVTKLSMSKTREVSISQNPVTEV